MAHTPSALLGTLLNRAGVEIRSYAPQVIADSSGQWVGNALRFATREEAEANVQNLAGRWFMVRDTRVVPSPDPVNWKWIDGQLVSLEEEAV